MYNSLHSAGSIVRIGTQFRVKGGREGEIFGSSKVGFFLVIFNYFIINYKGTVILKNVLTTMMAISYCLLLYVYICNGVMIIT